MRLPDATLGRVSSQKLEALRGLVGSFRSCLVAYSGGVDSVFLAKVASEVMGDRALAVIADTPSLPRRELQEAVALAKEHGIPLQVIRTLEFENPQYLANPENRCYYCKSELFSGLVPVARSRGVEVIFYGENASDEGDHRPGAKAAEEFQARAPLKEVGLTKLEIRELSKSLGLPTFDKPQMACLSSRVPYGESVTPEKLGMIEAAEVFLRDQGFVEVRVRHHELKGGHLARIELGQQELVRFFADGMASRVGAELRRAGYQHVTLDVLGYRRGSMNESPVFAKLPNLKLR